jgi:hypothetical protein
MNEILGQHDLLLESENRNTAEEYAHYFFDHNYLVRYDSVTIESNSIICGKDTEFYVKIEDGLKNNRQAIKNLVDELDAEGASDLLSWPTLQQGYITKLMHTAIHLVDGFFGIDSALYNLIENSHQVTDTLFTKIKKHPEKYWLVPVIGMSTSGSADRVQSLRPFGKEK